MADTRRLPAPVTSLWNRQIRAACRGLDLRVREPYGVWGGLSESDRLEIVEWAAGAAPR